MTSLTTPISSSPSARTLLATDWKRSQSASAMHCWSRSYMAERPAMSLESTPPCAVFANRMSGIRPILSATVNFSPPKSISATGSTRTPHVPRVGAAGRDLHVVGARDGCDRRGLREGGADLSTLQGLADKDAHRG